MAAVVRWHLNTSLNHLCSGSESRNLPNKERWERRGDAAHHPAPVACWEVADTVKAPGMSYSPTLRIKTPN